MESRKTQKERLELLKQILQGIPGEITEEKRKLIELMIKAS